MYKRVKQNPPPDPPLPSAFEFGGAFQFGNGELLRHENGQSSSNQFDSIFTYKNNFKNLTTKQQNPPMPVSKSEKMANFFITCVFSLLLVFLFPILGWFSVKKLEQHEKLVLMRLGRMRDPVDGPGVTCVLPLIDNWHKVDLRAKNVQVAQREYFTEDRGIVQLEAEVHYRVQDAELAVIAVAQPQSALRHAAEAAVQRSVAKQETEALLSNDTLARMQDEIVNAVNASCKNWGMKVMKVVLSKAIVLAHPPPRKALPDGIDFNLITQHIFGSLAQQQQQQQQGQGQEQNEQKEHTSVNVTGDTDVVKDGDPQQQQESGTSSSSSSSISEKELDSYIAKADRALQLVQIREELNAAYQFNVTMPDNSQKQYFLDARAGTAAAGVHESPDVTISLSFADLADLRSGQLPLWQAYAGGRLLLCGDIAAAKRLKVLND